MCSANGWTALSSVSIKEKGPKTKCSNYRPITLLSVPGKVFAYELLSRIQPLLEIICTQTTTIRIHRWQINCRCYSCPEAPELHREFDRPLYVAYLDIKAAFDSVDRIAESNALNSGRHYAVRASQIYDTIRHDTTILMCAQKPTDASLIYRTEPITKTSKMKKLMRSVILSQ